MNLLDLAQYVTPYVTGCPDPSIVQALRQVAREFSEYTRDYRATLTVPMVSGTETYDLSPSVPDNTLFMRIERIVRESDGEPIIPFRVEAFDVDQPGWEAETGPSVEAYTISDPSGVLRVYPIPDDDIDDNAVVTVSLKPTLTAATILDRFANQHAEYLGYGAAGILLKQGGKPWTDPEAGGHYYSLFAERMSKVRNRVLRDHTTAGSRVSTGGLESY